MNQPKLSLCDQNCNTTPLKCLDETKRGYCEDIACHSANIYSGEKIVGNASKENINIKL